MNLRECIGTTRSSPKRTTSLVSDIGKKYQAPDCNLPALIISKVAGRTLSVGTLCTGDNRWTKSKSSGLSGSPYSLVHALPNNDAFNLISIDTKWMNDTTHPRWIYGTRERIKNWIRNVCGTTKLPWEGLRHHLQQSQHQTFPRVPELMNHRQENLYFHRRDVSTPIKERNGVQFTAVGCTVDGHLAWTSVLVIDKKLTLGLREPT